VHPRSHYLGDSNLNPACATDSEIEDPDIRPSAHIGHLLDMPNKSYRTRQQSSVGTHAKALFLPMPRKEASDLALRARIALERLRNGEADHSLINLVSQIIIIVSFITPAGHGKLDISDIERVERDLGEGLLEVKRTATWTVPDTLIEGLTIVVNEYDRQICMTRMEIVARASNHLGKLVDLAAGDTRFADSDLRIAR
jgi:hypothetical protein